MVVVVVAGWDETLVCWVVVEGGGAGGKPGDGESSWQCGNCGRWFDGGGRNAT